MVLTICRRACRPVLRKVGGVRTVRKERWNGVILILTFSEKHSFLPFNGFSFVFEVVIVFTPRPVRTADGSLASGGSVEHLLKRGGFPPNPLSKRAQRQQAPFAEAKSNAFWRRRRATIPVREKACDSETTVTRFDKERPRRGLGSTIEEALRFWGNWFSPIQSCLAPVLRGKS